MEKWQARVLTRWELTKERYLPLSDRTHSNTVRLRVNSSTDASHARLMRGICRTEIVLKVTLHDYSHPNRNVTLQTDAICDFSSTCACGV